MRAVLGPTLVEIVESEKKLTEFKTYATTVLMLVGRKYKSPPIKNRQKLLTKFTKSESHEYFQKNSMEAKAFDKIQGRLKAAHLAKSDSYRKNQWHHGQALAEIFSKLLVLWKNV